MCCLFGKYQKRLCSLLFHAGSSYGVASLSYPCLTFTAYHHNVACAIIMYTYIYIYACTYIYIYIWICVMLLLRTYNTQRLLTPSVTLYMRILFRVHAITHARHQQCSPLLHNTKTANTIAKRMHVLPRRHITWPSFLFHCSTRRSALNSVRFDLLVSKIFVHKYTYTKQHTERLKRRTFTHTWADVE